jgi:GWxTD domain-containing protein
MIRNLAVLALIIMNTSLQAQVVRDLNFRYRYNPDEVVILNWDVVKEGNGYRIFYDAHLNDSSRFKKITIQFETRESVNDKIGNVITGNQNVLVETKANVSGSQSFVGNTNQPIVVAKVVAADLKKTYMQFFFYKYLAHAPAIYGTVNNRPISDLFINQNESATFSGFESNKPLHVSFYKDAFPAAAPAFSTTQARVQKVLKPDSTFDVASDEAVSFTQKGLYLVQQDTTSAQGVAFRVEADYPKLGKLESLVGPLIYVCTKQEFEKLKAAGNDKKKFDQIILSVTGNTERARIFIRNYFRRVELANQYFSSYKEGWKTDRGMIYIIYGLPDQVFLFADREVWEYKNDYVKDRFQFVRSATIFDPQNYVLIREKSFTDDWYNMIDLWRKARF